MGRKNPPFFSFFYAKAASLCLYPYYIAIGRLRQSETEKSAKKDSACDGKRSLSPYSVILIELERSRIELIIFALHVDELLMIAPLDDDAVLEHHDGVGISDSREPVRDDEHRSALH